MDRITAANEVAFKIGFSGHGGHLRLEPLPPVERSNSLKSLPDFILPPAFQPETPESVKKYLEERYLLPELDQDEFSAEKSGKLWDFDWFDKAKVHAEPSLPRYVVAPTWELPFRRSKNTASAGIWHPTSVEVELAELLEGAQDSGTLPRVPGPAKDFVRGSLNNRPFRPGGLDGSQPTVRILPEGAQTGDWVREIITGGVPQNVPPSFKKGLELGYLKEYPKDWKFTHGGASTVQSTPEQNLDGFSVQFDDLFRKAWEDDVTEELGTDGPELPVDPELSIDPELSVDPELSMPEVLQEESDDKSATSDAKSSALDEILLTDLGMEKRSQSEPSGNNKQRDAGAWAVAGGNVEIANRFHELVPEMALEFPFELDTFQKEAIYYLEQGESVFVAAHTSAGKTVVAEYAIALASKHCTRAVYTAPIKTISNQKYRDFCGKFDVGLLTGDVSLKPEASCLIMTTEILRSMLYRGADIIRDIEWVVFDEVHYVNDVERGVVWEEVIIMLPKHVNVVLLSATVATIF